MDYCGRNRHSESHPLEEHVGEGAKVLEKICEGSDVFLRMLASAAAIGPNYA
jgi:hypothetical protein